MKKTYINPTCKVRVMRIEAIMANSPVVDPNDPNGIVGDEGTGIGWGGEDNGGGGDAKKNVWDE